MGLGRPDVPGRGSRGSGATGLSLTRDHVTAPTVGQRSSCQQTAPNWAREGDAHGQAEQLTWWAFRALEGQTQG